MEKITIQVSGSPFDLPEDIWRSPTDESPRLNTSSFLFPEFNTKHESPLNEDALLHAVKLKANFTSLFERSPFALPFDEATSLQEAKKTASTELNNETNITLHDSKDIWLEKDILIPQRQPRYLTWDTFLTHGADDPPNPYLTEASSGIVDAALAHYLNDIYSPNEAGQVICLDLLIYCLLQLALGRASVLFQLNAEELQYVNLDPRLRISGTTVETSESAISFFIECGSNIKRLERFSENVYNGISMTSCPYITALAQCINSALIAIERSIIESAGSMLSILQLQNSIRTPATVVACLAQIINNTRTDIQDHEMLSSMFNLVQTLEYGDAHLQVLLVEILARFTSPWWQLISDWIGLGEDPGSTNTHDMIRRGLFLKYETAYDEEGQDVPGEDELLFDTTKVPVFMQIMDAECVFETGRALKILSEHDPKHPLVNKHVNNVVKPALAWLTSWDDLDRIQQKATAYEKGIRQAIHNYHHGVLDKTNNRVRNDVTSSQHSCFPEYGISEAEVEEGFKRSIHLMSGIPGDIPHSQSSADSILQIVSTLCSTQNTNSCLLNHAPPLSITPKLSFSYIVNLQNDLANAAVMRLLFKQLNLREHLALLQRFFFFGDGVFVAKLSHALFDEELESADRREGIVMGGNMGLKLGARDSWPPASSELRLALTGILSECYKSASSIVDEGNAKPYKRQDDLPGDLNFMVRDMTEEELERCMNPDSLEALDFLRLQYRPPSPLNIVISPSTINKYDRVFKFLLRIMRLSFVCKQLFHGMMTTSRAFTSRKDDSQSLVTDKFRIEANHFISSICKYVFESGVNEPWRRFVERLDGIQDSLEQDMHEDGHTMYSQSLGQLIEFHEQVLNRILFATLLRKRQAPIMKILEEIMSIVLLFARHIRTYGFSASDETVHETQDDEDTITPNKKPKDTDAFIAKLYVKFHKRVAIFINVCKGLNEKRGYGESTTVVQSSHDTGRLLTTSVEEEGGMLGQLLIKLEMTGYYLSPNPSTGRSTKVTMM